MHLLMALILTGLALPRVRGAAVTRYSGDGEIGKVTWGPCTIPGALNGTECGFIKCVVFAFTAGLWNITEFLPKRSLGLFQC